MAITLNVSQELISELEERKSHHKESYEDVIWDLLEDTLELSEQTQADIKKSEEDIKARRIYTCEEVKMSLGL